MSAVAFDLRMPPTFTLDDGRPVDEPRQVALARSAAGEQRAQRDVGVARHFEVPAGLLGHRGTCAFVRLCV